MKQAQKILTPLEVIMLLEYHCNADGCHSPSDAHTEARLKFQKLDVLVESKGRLELTQKGKAWVRALLCTPCPECVWINAQGDQLLPRISS